MILLALAAGFSWAAPVQQVSPTVTDPQIRQISGPHVFIHPEQQESDSPLLITLGGTGSAARDLGDLQQAAADMGYHVIGVDYPNGVITTACRGLPDHECFNKFRSEIGLGIPASDLVQVDSNNCIVRRIYRLLSYLKNNDPAGHWNKYVSEDYVDWSQVVIAGHSQGSGHAAYLAKMFPMNRVILLSGPQDVAPWGTASWLSADGVTPVKNFFALLHAGDVFNTDWQVKAMRQLVQDPFAPVMNIDDQVPQLSDSQILVSHVPVQNAHMAPLSPSYKKVWAWLLRRRVKSSGL